MNPEALNPDLFDRYLRLLGIPRRAPGLRALTELVAAQAMRVPFENVSKLYYRKRYGLRALPGLERFLEGVERYNFGGTCYSTNYYFSLLLARLGFQVKLCGADMANPDVHVVSMVAVEGREYLVDVGYAAPFLEPLPRGLDRDHVIELGRDRYVVKPLDEDGRTRVELYRNDKLKHGYTAKPAPRRIEEFAQVIEDSFDDQATFMNALLLVRFMPNRSLAVQNLKLIRSEGKNSRIQTIAGREDLPMVVEEHFAIPGWIVELAVKELGQLQDAWS
jgi:arylamine N-acetyltransferase